MTASAGVAGYNQYNGETYVHTTAGEGVVRFAAAPARHPYLADANGRIEGWRAQGKGFEFTLRGYMPLEFTLENAASCRVHADGKPLAPAGKRYRIGHGTAATIQVDC